MTHVLIVEDEARLRKDLVDFLGLCGFSASGVSTALELRQTLAETRSPDVIVLDVGLPDGNGFELASEIRESHRCDIIMLTALGDSDDRIRGFESGADIYLVKHSTLREIEAAIRSLLRRNGSSPGSAGNGDQWVLDGTNWLLTAPNHRSLKLTATEFAFLDALCSRGGTCQRDGVDDPGIVAALVPGPDVEWFASFRGLWRLGGDGRFTALDPAGVRCRNEGFGYDG